VFRTRPPNPRIRAARAVLPHDGILDYPSHLPRDRHPRTFTMTPLERAEQREFCLATLEVVIWIAAAVSLSLWLSR
jgi:hypothetical protein